MIFFLNLFFSTIISYIFGWKYRGYTLSVNAKFLLFLFFGIFWLIILGGQYYVGTDYPTYLSLFEGNNIDYYYSNGEYLFYWTIYLCNQIGIKGQALFYIFYAINSFIIFLILKRIKVNYYFIFIILYITYSNIFNNQLNILRQSLAIHLCTLAFIEFCENKTLKSLLLIIVSSMFHVSSIIMVVIYLLKYTLYLSQKKLKCILIFSIIGSFIISYQTINLISGYLPDTYANHLINENNTTSIINIITKYIFIPIFWFSTGLLSNNSLTKFEKKLYYCGYLGFCIKILLLRMPIVNRLADYFIIISIFPIFFYIRYFFIHKKTFLFLSLILFFLCFYAVKTVLMPQSEYLYNSIYF